MKDLKLDWNLFDKCFETVENKAQKALNNIMVRFEEDLLQTAIKLKARHLYAVNFNARNYSGGSTTTVKYELFYKFFLTEKEANAYARALIALSDRRNIIEYNFDKLLSMIDIEFEGMPDLGNKDLVRKYRQVMRDK